MPPHGRHGGHHHGSYGIGPWWGPDYGQSWDPSMDRRLAVIDNEGKAPGKGALGGAFEIAEFLTSPPGLTLIAIAAYFVFRKKKR